MAGEERNDPHNLYSFLVDKLLVHETGLTIPAYNMLYKMLEVSAQLLKQSKPSQERSEEWLNSPVATQAGCSPDKTPPPSLSGRGAGVNMIVFSFCF